MLLLLLVKIENSDLSHLRPKHSYNVHHNNIQWQLMKSCSKTRRQTPVLETFVGPLVLSKWQTEIASVLVFLVTLVLPHIVVRSVFSAPTVPKTRLASIKNARIPVQVVVVSMHAAM